MKCIISDGYTSEFVVLSMATGKPVAGVYLMFPFHDKDAYEIVREHVSDDIKHELDLHWHDKEGEG